MPQIRKTGATRQAVVTSCAAIVFVALALPAHAQCEAVPNGNFESGLTGWTSDPQNTQTGQATAGSNAELANSDLVGPPFSGQAALISASAFAIGEQPGVVNQSHASITLSAQGVVHNRYLVFDGFGSWEMLRSGGGTGSYEFRAEVEDADGNIAARSLGIFGSPPPLGCGIGMSILGIVASKGPFALDVLFTDGEPTGISIGESVTLRLRLECSAGAVTPGCDQSEFGVGVFVDNFRFCAEQFGCPDVSGDGEVGVDDLLAVIADWGQCVRPPGGKCPADFNQDNAVDVDDLLAVISGWGTCG